MFICSPPRLVLGSVSAKRFERWDSFCYSVFCLIWHSRKGARMKRQSKPAGSVVVLENNDAIAAQAEEIQNRIRERAYELSQMRGHPGREMDDWLSAESDIISVPPMDIVE